MILEYTLDYRSSSQIYQKIFLQTIKESNLQGNSIKGNISQEHFTLKLFVESESVEGLEEFADRFASNLPHSIFLYGTQATIVEEMSSDTVEIVDEKRLAIPPCPKCLRELTDSSHPNYYNIFTECEVCGYEVDGINRSYKEEFSDIAQVIQQGKVVTINTFYGTYSVGIPSSVCNDISFDILAYNLGTIQRYAHIQEYGYIALGALEKPSIKFKKTIKFTVDYEDVTKEIIRFKLPDDCILYLLMDSLHALGIDMVFITKDQIDTFRSLSLIEPQEELEPIEVVVSKDNIAIVSGDKALPNSISSLQDIQNHVDYFFLIMQEYELDDKSIVGINLSRYTPNSLIVYGEKYGVVEYLPLHFTFSSISDIFVQIQRTNETGEKIVENYQKAFPEHFDTINKIIFEKKEFNIYTLWGLIAIILGLTKTDNPIEAAGVLEERAMSFLGTKGPRIDYKLYNKDGKVYLDPLMAIRTAMSFKLAGVDEFMLSYGVIESFSEFITTQLDDIKVSMDTTAVVATGSLLSNKHLFSKLSTSASLSHNIYFGNELHLGY